MQFPKAFKTYFIDFAKLYHRYRVEIEQLRHIRYRIKTDLIDYQRTKKIELSITDKPGDILPPMTIKEIKNASDIISEMHPIDVNSINDLYYLTKDKLKEIQVFENKIVGISDEGNITAYSIEENLDIAKVNSPRIAYMLGYVQAEKFVKMSYKETTRYKVAKDNISTLEIEDLKTGNTLLKNPSDILFTNEYKEYSKEDIARIGFICGQLSKIK